MSKIMYRACSYFPIEIIAHEIIRETPKQVTYMRGDRKGTEAKEAQYHSWHDTFEEAKNYLINRQKCAIRSVEGRLLRENKTLQKIESLTPPQSLNY